MNTSIEQLLSKLPKQKLSRVADFKIRFRLLRFYLSQRWQLPDLSLANGWQAGLAMALIVFVGLSSTGVYAYSSDKVNRQNPLYPIKRTLENIEKTAFRGPAAQSSFQAKLATRRLAEANTLINDSADLDKISDDLDLTLNEARENFKSASEIADIIDNDTDQKQAIKRLEADNQKHIRGLEQIAGKLSLDNDEKVVDAVATTLEDLEQRNQSRERPRAIRATQQDDQPTLASSSDIRPDFKPVSSGLASSSNKETKRTDDRESLKKMKQSVASFKKKQEGKSPEKSNPKAKKFIRNLEKKIDQAQSFIERGDTEGFLKIYQTTNALTDTGDHFIAPVSGGTAITTTDSPAKESHASEEQKPESEWQNKDGGWHEERKTETETKD